MTKQIAFIGAGNMAESIISGMISKKLYEPTSIIVTNKSNEDKLEQLRQTYSIKTSQNVSEAIHNAEMVILAMKPKDVVDSLESIKEDIRPNQLLMSVIAGVSSESMLEILNTQIPIIRAMPNTSATIGKSATALCKGRYATDQHLHKAISLFETIGTVSVVKEEALHAVTGLSGSGPAYIYYIVEAMEKAAINLGLEREVAENLVAQTIIGAGEMLKASPKKAATLRKEVMSPGGTTEAGIKVLEESKIQETMISCIERAAQRSTELGEELANMMIKNK